jgi:hypothetical protein
MSELFPFFCFLVFAFASLRFAFACVPRWGSCYLLLSFFLSGRCLGTLSTTGLRRSVRCAGDFLRVSVDFRISASRTRVSLFVSLSFLLLVILAPPFPILLIHDSRSAHSRGCGWMG